MTKKLEWKKDDKIGRGYFALVDGDGLRDVLAEVLEIQALLPAYEAYEHYGPEGTTIADRCRTLDGACRTIEDRYGESHPNEREAVESARAIRVARGWV